MFFLKHFLWMIMSRIWKHNPSEWFEIDPKYVFSKNMEMCISKTKNSKYLKYSKYDMKDYLAKAEKHYKRKLQHEQIDEKSI